MHMYHSCIFLLTSVSLRFIWFCIYKMWLYLKFISLALYDPLWKFDVINSCKNCFNASKHASHIKNMKVMRRIKDMKSVIRDIVGWININQRDVKAKRNCKLYCGFHKTYIWNSISQLQLWDTIWGNEYFNCISVQ